MWLVLTLLACGSPEPEAPSEAPAAEPVAAAAPAVDPADPASCAPCHGKVVSEWNESMHARAHQDNDPVFAAMRTLRMEKQGEGVADKCAQCHTPMAPADQESAAAKAGVSCGTCHLTTAVDLSQKGRAALTHPEGPPVMVGPHDLKEGASPAHGTGGAGAHLVDGKTLCLACHGEMKNPKGAPTCTTGSELPEDGPTCTSCHMPRVEGASGVVSTRADHASHAFLGPHRAWYQDDPSLLEQAVELQAAREGNTVKATLHNRSAHAMPTGFPGRMAMILVTATDAEGNELWRNITDNPMKQDPKASLMKVYVDDAGKPTLPPFAAKLAKDTRLEPGEARALSWDVPEGTVKVEIALVFRLLPPPGVKALGLDGTPEAQPKKVVLASLEGAP